MMPNRKRGERREREREREERVCVPWDNGDKSSIYDGDEMKGDEKGDCEGRSGKREINFCFRRKENFVRRTWVYF